MPRLGFEFFFYFMNRFGVGGPNRAAEGFTEELAGICDAPQVLSAFRNVTQNFPLENRSLRMAQKADIKQYNV